MQDFTVYPAIDLRAGKVVRLLRGDPAFQTTYGNDPAEIARRWFTSGASWIHVINLDGAFGEKGTKNSAALKEIVKAAKSSSPIPQVQFGGGLRSLEDIDQAITAGVSRVILGTIAIENPDLLEKALHLYGSDCVALAIDAKNNQVAVHGWTKQTKTDPISLGKRFYNLGLRTAIFTNIIRDGSGEGVDVTTTKRVAAATGLSMIASGGVASLEDILQVRKAGLSGVIIGRALYEGTIDLEEALTC